MIKALCTILIAFAVAPTFAATPAPAGKEVAIIHFDQLKDRKIEGTAKNLTLKPVIGRKDQTTYFRLLSNLFVPREITVSILGLTEPEYDIYIDGNLIGTKKREELESGIPVSFSGTDVPPQYRDYYTHLKSGALAGAQLYKSATEEDAALCRDIMRAVANWVGSIESTDRDVRTVNIIPVPAGRPISLPNGHLILPPPDFPKSVKHLGKAVQIIRGEVVKKVENGAYRFDTLASITPIDFKLVTPKAFTPGKKVSVRATLTNWTDRTITGKVKLTVPTGWKVRELKSSVDMPAFSKNAEAKFEVTVPKSAKPDPAISADADLMVEGIQLKLITRAESR